MDAAGQRRTAPSGSRPRASAGDGPRSGPSAPAPARSRGRSSGRGTCPAPGRAVRDERHEQRIAEHVQRHKERGARPPRRDRGLSRDEIVRTAIAVADAEGPEAISMRRIARELRAGAMSLYWYVGSKEELLDLMLEASRRRSRCPSRPATGGLTCGVFAHQIRAALSRHPWALEFIGSGRPAGPNDARNLERLLGMLDGLGLDARLTMDFRHGRHLRDGRGHPRGPGDPRPARAGAGRGRT